MTFSRRPGTRTRRLGSNLSTARRLLLQAGFSVTPHTWLRADQGWDSSAGTWTSITNGRVFSEATNKPTLVTLSELYEQRALRFDGSNDKLVSTAPASTWKFLHDGTGCEVFCVGVQRSVGTAAQTWFATQDSSASANNVGIWKATYHSPTRLNIVLVGNGSSRIINEQSTPYVGAGRAAIMNFRWKNDGGSPEWVNYTMGEGTSGTTGSPSTSDPTGTLTLGSRTDGTNFGFLDVAEIIIFDRVLTASERTAVNAYLESRYDLYQAASDSSMFFRLASTVVNDGSGNASAWNAESNSLFSASFNGAKPVITSADSNFGGRTSLALSGTRGTLGGSAAQWVKSHDTTDFKLWAVVRPNANSTGSTQVIFNGMSDFAAASTGLNLSYDGTYEALEVFMGRGTSPRFVAVTGASGSVPRSQTHVVLVHKQSSKVDVYVNGSLNIRATYGETPSTASISINRTVGGDALTAGRDFSGDIAEIGASTTTKGPGLIHEFLRDRYAVSTTSSYNHEFTFTDGANHTLASNTTVKTRFNLTSSKPGDVWNAGKFISRGTVYQVRNRSNGTPWPITTPSPITDVSQFATCFNLTGSAGPVAAGKTRKLVLAIGESGMSGRSSTGSLPAGYPPADTSLWTFDDEFQWSRLSEPTDAAKTYPVNNTLTEGATPGVGPAGLFCWYMQQELGTNYEVGLIQCAKGGSTSTNWQSGSSMNNNYAASLYRLKAALQEPNTELECIIMDQGINDATGSAPLGWADRWSAVINGIRSYVPEAANVPVIFRREQNEEPTDVSYPGWAAMLAEQDGWEQTGSVPWRVKVYAEPTGWVEAGHVHADTPSNIALARQFFFGWQSTTGSH